MSPLYLYNGLLLKTNGALAASQDCCCEVPCTYCSSTTGSGCYLWDPPGNMGSRGGCSGVDIGQRLNNKLLRSGPYPTCAGRIYLAMFTGNALDKLTVDAATMAGVVGPRILDTGCVQHGTSDWRTNPAGLVFGEYFVCKPAGYDAILLTWTECQPGGATFRVGNCLLGPC